MFNFNNFNFYQLLAQNMARNSAATQSSQQSQNNASFLENNDSFPEILTQSRFYLELQLSNSTEADAYFMECRGFKYYQDVIEFGEIFPQTVGDTTIGSFRKTKMPGNYNVDNIGLKKGLSSSQTLWEWIYDVQNRNWANLYQDGSLTIYTQAAEIGAQIEFYDAWPVSYTIADMSASGTELAFEELEIACSSIKRVV